VLEEVHERAVGLLHAERPDVESAALEAALDRLAASRRELARRTRDEPDSYLAVVDQSITGYLTQVSLVKQQALDLDRLPAGPEKTARWRQAMEAYAHLDHQHQTVLGAMQALARYHKEMLELAIRSSQRNARQLSIFAGVSILLATGFCLAGGVAFYQRHRSQALADHLQTLIDTIPDGVVAWNTQGDVLRLNPGLATLLGIPSLRHAVGWSIRTALSEETVRRLEEAPPDRPVRLNLVHASGALRAVDASVGHIDGVGGPHFIAVLRDVSHEVEHERRMVESQWLADVGRRASAIAKDLEYTMHPVLFAQDLLKPDSGSPASQVEAWKTLHRASEQAALLLRQFGHLAASSGEPPDERVFDLHVCLQDVIQSFHLNRGTMAGIEVDLDPGPSPVHGPVSLIRRSIELVIQRALDAAGGKTPIRVLSHQARGSVVVRIQDPGRGESDEELARVFDPVFCVPGAPINDGFGTFNVAETMRGIGGWVGIARTGRGWTEITFKFPLESAS
jgi:two-component system sensor kinase FixL